MSREVQSGMGVPISSQGSNSQVGADQTAVWANSAAANTPVNVDFTQQPRYLTRKHRVQVHNPSGVTALTVKVYNIVTLGGATRYALVKSFAVAVNQTVEELGEGLFGGTSGVRLTLSNDTVLGAGDGFTSDVAIREA
jgi:hypothetical protein